MIVAIHQPQYLPWWPYMQKVADCDLFISLDSVDFQKNGLQNRNRIKTAQGAQWLTVPVKQRLGQKICEVQIDEATDWRRKHWQTIRQNYGKAPAFADYAAQIEATLGSVGSSLSELNHALFQLLLGWLGIERPIRRSSGMHATGQGSELVLNLCREAGAKQYLSGIGGRSYLDEAAFAAAGIEIRYVPPSLPTHYPQLHQQAGFLNDLSVLDLLLNCGSSYRDYLPANVVTA